MAYTMAYPMFCLHPYGAHFSVADAVIGEETNRCTWAYNLHDIINEQIEENGPRTVPWGTPDVTHDHSETGPLTTTRCLH